MNYLEMLQALFIVFAVHPSHHSVPRGLMRMPKICFCDMGLVRGYHGVKLENATATMLLKHLHFFKDNRGGETELHYIRTKDGTEVDFAVSHGRDITDLIECKASDASLYPALKRFAGQWPQAHACGSQLRAFLAGESVPPSTVESYWTRGLVHS